METLIFLALGAVDVVLIVGMVFFGWRPFRGIFKRIWKRALRFLGVFFGTLIGLTIAFPWIDTAFYDAGYVLDDDWILFVYPALTIFLSLSAAVSVVWELDRKHK